MSTTYNEEERQQRLKKFRASKSKLVLSKEYDGPNGKILEFNSQKCIPDFPSKFGGTVVKYDVYDPENGMDREVHASNLSYVNAIEAILSQKPLGTSVRIRVKRTGNGNDVRYSAEAA